ncbi:hypothetical protein GH754_02840 [Salinibacillus xinjiangensis]|uniref:Uncharacterized protein n=1 Tax=Salinibacillus xinjiangensis TaxID=1229268 RepID=A0A6G1X2Y4_9BACI|nr:hypothetical protein [Salinibacillus xinjiangensis]
MQRKLLCITNSTTHKITAAFMVGYEHYYLEFTADEDKQINEYEELVVSDKAKLELLELFVKI